MAGSENWPSTGGTVTISELVEGRNDKRKTFEHKFRFEYHVNNKKYVGHMLSCGFLAYTRNKVNSQIEEYPVGKTLNVHYNPKWPKFSVIIPGGIGKTANFLGGIGVLLCAISLFFLK